jgi:uncharacterized protein (DUF58 family)
MTEHRIEWRPAGWPVGGAVVAVVAAFGAVLAGRFDLVVFGAPLVGALAGAWWGGWPARTLRVRVTARATGLFEGETGRLGVELAGPPGVELVAVSLAPDDGLDAVRTRLERPAPNRAAVEWELRAPRWGRRPVRLEVTARGAGGLLVGAAACELAELVVLPRPERVGAVPRPIDLLDPLGVHPGRRTGEGPEFAGLREYRPGDPLRAVNWPVTARRGTPYVTERLAEQAARVVTLIDASVDAPQPGGSTLDLSARGALAVVAAALRRGDRAGLLVLGGAARWLPPNLGRRQFYRILDALLDPRPSAASAPGVFGPAVLPSGAAVLVFSPLLDDRVVRALVDLRRRGHALAVVDVLRAEPTARAGVAYDEIAVRMWRIGRAGVRRRLADLGIPVGVWAPGVELDEVLRPMSRRPLIGARG